MARFIKPEAGVLIQGITGREGSYHTNRMLDYGTKIVAGVTPGKGGEWLELENRKIPVFDTVKAAISMTGAKYSVNFVPAEGAVTSLFEALEEGIEIIVSHTRGIPVHSMIDVMALASRNGSTIIGPACAGVLVPGQTQLGVIPGSYAIPGNTGIISTSGSLAYEVIQAMTTEGMGSSIVLSIGSEKVRGVTLLDALGMLEEDQDTDRILVLGTPRGREEIDAAALIAQKLTKPVYFHLSGRRFLNGVKSGLMRSTAELMRDKQESLEAVGVRLIDDIRLIPEVLK